MTPARVLFVCLGNICRSPLAEAAFRDAAEKAGLKVQVDSVQVCNTKGKLKRFKGQVGRRKSWKKAFVCLKPGQEINFAEGGAA